MYFCDYGLRMRKKVFIRIKILQNIYSWEKRLQKMIKKFLLTSVLFTSIFLFACSQDHQSNKTWLNQIQEIEKTTVVLNNEKQILPIVELEDLKIASVSLGFDHASVFDSLLRKYHKVESLSKIDINAIAQLEELSNELKFFNLVLLQIPAEAVYEESVLEFVEGLQQHKKVIICLFGNGACLLNLNKFTVPIVWSPHNNAVAAQFSAQLIFGGVATNAKLPITYSEKYIQGTGFPIIASRLGYTVPEALGINCKDLYKIDDIVKEAIDAKAIPGAVVLVAKDGKVIFNKAYGSHTYSKQQSNKINDIFDLASITKTAATTMAVMKLYENQQIGLDSFISKYLPITRNTDKSRIRVKDVMLHQAGFIPFIPFYAVLKPINFSRDSSALFSMKVADSFYMSKNYYYDVMWKQMTRIPLRTSGKYVYSDLSMYFMKEIIERVTGQPLPEYVQENFYDKLGMYSTGFNPRNKFDKEQIVPTEQDAYFRKTLLWGYVHDQGSAMAGGVAGHAGLFSSANDLAILHQMLLNRGIYGGQQFFNDTTVNLFTTRQSNTSRRGLGFDRWDPESNKKYPSEYASSQTYGHTGYTGTCVWVDPKENLIYIFLSNRVHPKVSNKLSEMNVRPRIQDVIYKAIALSK